MLNFDKLLEKINTIRPEEMQNMIYSALDQSGIEYEKGKGKIFFEELPEITLEDIYDPEDIACMREWENFELSYDTTSDTDDIEFYQTKNNIGKLEDINIQNDNEVKKYSLDDIFIAA